MQVTFPAMRGPLRGREYYATIMALSEIPRFFKYGFKTATRGVVPASLQPALRDITETALSAKFLECGVDISMARGVVRRQKRLCPKGPKG